MKPFSVVVRKYHEQAQANADYFGVPYACFFDTSGNYRVERYDKNSSRHRFDATVFFPKNWDADKAALT